MILIAHISPPSSTPDRADEPHGVRVTL
jgi:hypothetical protein